MANPLVFSYTKSFQPLLNVINGLRHHNFLEEGVELPTIVAVGDQSSDKASVIEAHAGISLPKGEGICTRVPLIICLRDDPSPPSPPLYLQYEGNRMGILSEESSEDVIQAVTVLIAGKGKSYFDTPLTLMFHKHGVPELTIINLSDCPLAPAAGELEHFFNITVSYMQLSTNNILFNVLLAGSDFSTSQSVRMCRQVDGSGERTLGVITKADKWSEKWNAALVDGTQEDPPLNPYGKRLRKEVHALYTAFVKLCITLTAAHSAFVKIMDDLKFFDGGDGTFGVEER
ncbi:putative dynamin-related protein 4A [Platanthera guangdongensis]|uniref:Dynamin-related protein 4A n=1 Tax=Platanthera guangdongensis TaxID=2320717 RepID=A0ABR2N5Y2_9ASPA